MSVNIGKATGYLDLDISGFKSSLNQAGKDLKQGLGDMESGSEGSGNKVVKTFQGVGSNLTKYVTTPIIGIGTATVGIGSKFDTEMSKVSAIAKASGSDYDKLREKAIAMGYDGWASSQEVAEGFEYMAMAGWETKDMLDGIEPIIKLTKASGSQLATVSDIVTDAITGFGLSAKDTSHFVDVLATASTSSNTNVEMLGESFKYAAPVCNALGYTVDDAAIALGLMANSGIKASQAGTTLRTAFTNMAKPTKTMAEVMDKYNISLTNADGTMKPMRQTMQELREKFGGLSEAEQVAAASALFGKEAYTGMLAIVNATEKDWNTLINNIDKCDGSSETMAKTMKDNLQGSLTEVKNKLSSIAIDLSGTLIPIIKKVVDKIAEWVGMFQKLTPQQQETIVKIAALVAAIGPLITVVTNVISFFDKFNKIIGVVKLAVGPLGSVLATLASNPMTLVITTIGILVANFIHLWNTNEDFRKAVIKIWDDVKAAFKKLGENISQTIKDIVKWFTDMKTKVANTWNDVKKTAVDTWEGIKKSLKEKCDSIAKYWSDTWNSVKQSGEKIWGGLKTTADNTFSWIKKHIVDPVTDAGKTVKDKAKEISDKLSFTGLKGSVEKVFKDIKGFMSDPIGSAKKLITDNISSITSKFTFDGAAKKAQEAFANIKKNISMDSIKKTVTDAIDSIKKSFDFGSGASSYVAQALTNIRTAVWDRLGSWTKSTSIYSYVKTGIDNIKKAFNVTLPHPTIKLPKIGWSGKFSLNPWEVPKFNITWFAKAKRTPFILDGATIFGSIGDQLLGGGETGREVVVGEQKLIEMIVTAMKQLFKDMEALGGVGTGSSSNAFAESLERGFEKVSVAIKGKQGDTKTAGGTAGNTFVFNSPKAIDEVEAAKQIRRTMEELSFI